jgi:hypothetical protein
MAYYVKVWSLPTVASFFQTGGHTILDLRFEILDWQWLIM